MKDPSKKAQMEKRFSRMDTDKNGSVDKAEFKVALEKPRASQQRKSMEKKTIEKKN